MSLFSRKAAIWFALSAALLALPASYMWGWSLTSLLGLVLCPVMVSGIAAGFLGKPICIRGTDEPRSIKRGAAIATIAWFAMGVAITLAGGSAENPSYVRAFTSFLIVSVPGLPIVIVAGMISAKLLQMRCVGKGEQV